MEKEEEKDIILEVQDVIISHGMKTIEMEKENG